MKVLEHLRDYWFGYLLMVLLLTLIFLRVTDLDYYSKTKIFRLEDDNAKLFSLNNQLLHELDSIKKENILLEESLVIVVRNDSLLRVQMDSITKKINVIRSLYEKAKHRPNNFNSDSLLWYFSNI